MNRTSEPGEGRAAAPSAGKCPVQGLSRQTSDGRKSPCTGGAHLEHDEGKASVRPLGCAPSLAIYVTIRASVVSVARAGGEVWDRCWVEMRAGRNWRKITSPSPSNGRTRGTHVLLMEAATNQPGRAWWPRKQPEPSHACWRLLGGPWSRLNPVQRTGDWGKGGKGKRWRSADPAQEGAGLDTQSENRPSKLPSRI